MSWDFPNNQTFWIGLNDEVEEATFRGSNGQPVQSGMVKWSTSQPNGGTNENCVYAIGADGLLGDLPCRHGRPFVCQSPSEG